MIDLTGDFAAGFRELLRIWGTGLREICLLRKRNYCGLTVKSIDDWPTLWPKVSSMVSCKV